MAQGKDINISITGASATTGAAIRGVATFVTLAGPTSGIWPETVTEVQALILAERRQVNEANAAKRKAAIVKALEQYCEAREIDEPSISRAFARRHRKTLEALLRTNGTLKEKEPLGLDQIKEAAKEIRERKQRGKSAAS